MRAVIVLVAALSAGLALAITAFAAPDRTVKLSSAAAVATWDGTPALGVNQTFTEQELLGLGTCGKLPVNYCEDTLVQADVPAGGTKLKITIDGFGPVLPPPPSPVALFDDFDAYVYKSDATGKVGDFVFSDTQSAGVPEVLTIDNASGFYLVRVVYYATLQAGYKGKVELLGVPGATGSPTTGPTTAPLPGVTPSPTPTPAPVTSTGKPSTLPASGPLTISYAVDKGKRKTARKRGLRVRVRCSVQCKTTAVAKIDKKVAKALKLGKKALTIAKGSATITKPGRIPFFVKLSSKAKKALARKKVKKFKVKIALTVTDTSGKQIKRGTKTITLR